MAWRVPVQEEHQGERQVAVVPCSDRFPFSHPRSQEAFRQLPQRVPQEPPLQPQLEQSADRHRDLALHSRRGQLRHAAIGLLLP